MLELLITHWAGIMFFRRMTSAFLLLAALAALTACDKPEDKAQKYVQKGNVLFDKGEYAKARLEYKNAARILPAYAEARFKLALVDEAEGKIGPAMAGFIATEQQSPQFLPALLKIAQYYIVAEQYDEARKRLDSALEIAPQNAMAHALRASLLLRLKDYNTAEKEAALSLQYEPDNVQGLASLAGIYTALKNYDKAIATADKGLAAHPNELSLHLLKIMIYAQTDNLPKIAETYEAIFKLRPDEARHRFDLADLYAKAGKKNEAEAVLRAGASALPNHWDIRRKLVDFLSENKGLDAAESEVKAYMTAAPDHADLTFWLASLYMKHNVPERAIVILEKAMAQDDNEKTSLNARTSLARIRLTQGNKELAANLVAAVLKKDPSNADALFVRARLAFERGELDEAVADFRTIMRDHPDSTKTLFLLSEALLSQGHTDLAIDTLAQLLSVDPTDQKARVRMAQLYAVRKDTKRALEILALVTKLDPSYSVGWESTARIAISAKNWALAEAALQTLAPLEGQKNVATFLKGQMSAARGNPEEALSLYQQAIAADPTAPLTEHALRALIELGAGLKKSEQVARFMDDLKGQGPVFDSLYGDALFKSNRTQDAAAALDRAIAQRLPMQEPYLLRAQILVKEHQNDEAFKLLQLAQETVPFDPRASLAMADLLATQNKPKEAVAIYEKLLTKTPSFDLAANNMAQLIADTMQGDLAAMEKARLAAERFTGSPNPYYLDTLGWVYFRQGNIVKAQPLLEKSIGMVNPVPAQMLYHYGALLEKLGQSKEAKEALTRAVAGDAPYPGLDEAKTLLQSLK